jgi:dTMP kinase
MTFITFEGIDGVGKTTQIDLLAKYIESHSSATVVKTREPGGTQVGSKLRDIILHGNPIDRKTELLLYIADRTEHVAKVIKPALANGNIVISDRYMDSTLAYQVAGRGIDANFVKSLNNWASAGAIPDKTFLLNMDLQVAFGRFYNGSQDKLESEDFAFYKRVQEAFLKLAKNDARWVVLDGNLPVEAIHSEIVEQIKLDI